MLKTLSTMPLLRGLTNGLLVDVLDLVSDASALELSAASAAVKWAVEECRLAGSRFPWQHPPGKLHGLWRLFGLGDLKRKAIPFVTLRCEAEFENSARLVAFLKAANYLAADTIDGQVTFDNKFVFEASDVANLYYGEDDGNGRYCTAGLTEVLFNDCPLTCGIDGHRSDGDEVPWINVCVFHQDLPQNPMIICSSLLLPELRMVASDGDVHNTHGLQADSPVTALVQASKALPVFFGVKGFATI